MLTALIVIYNKSCLESTTFKFIRKYKKKMNIIVFDNSTIDYGNSEYCEKQNITYYTVNQNIGLSRAYNFILNKIKLSKSNYILILDDDTTLNDNYIREVLETINIDNADVLLPLVWSNNELISPSSVSFNCRVKQIKDVSFINRKNITAINSGMVIRTSIYNDIKYNENLFLDYVDHDFMKNIREKNYNIKILSSSIYQSFSRNEKQPLSSVKIRFNIYKKDFKKYCINCNKKWFYYINIWKLRLVYFFKYKRLF